MTYRITSRPSSRRHRLPPGLVLGVAAAVSGCGSDATGPAGEVEVRLTASARSEVFDASPEPSRVECRIDLTATATGGPGEGADWLGAVVSFRGKLDGAAEFFSLMMPRGEMPSVWGADRIDGGETLEGGLLLWANVPFRAVGEFRYAAGPDGRERTAEFDVGCGPGIAEGATGAPTGSGLTVFVPPDAFEPLDTLTVSYSAASPLGLWRTIVVLSGAFEDTLHFLENQALSTDRTTRIVVPQGTPLGRNVDVRVFVEDVGLQTVGSPTKSSPPLEDVTPPGVHVSLEPFVGDCRTGPCQYATGDSIGFSGSGGDNHSLAWLVYEIGDPVVARDSIAFSSARWYGLKRVRVPAAWLGTHPVRAVMRDATGNVDTDTGPDGQRIHVYPAREQAAESLSLELELADAALDAARGRLYLSARGREEIVVVALDPLAVEASIPLPGPADGFDLSIGGDSLLVVIPDSNAIAVVDLARPGSAPALAPLTAIDTAAGYRAASLRVTSNGKWFVTANGEDDPHHRYARLVEVDPVAGTESIRLSPADFDEDASFHLHRLVRSGDRTRMLVSMTQICTYLYDAGTDALGPCVSYDTRGPRAPPAPDWTGSRWATMYELYDADLTPLGPLPVRGTTNVTAPAPDGLRVYTASGRGFDVVDPVTGLMQERIPAPYLWDGRLLSNAAGDLVVAVGTGYFERSPTRVVVLERP